MRRSSLTHLRRGLTATLALALVAATGPGGTSASAAPAVAPAAARASTTGFLTIRAFFNDPRATGDASNVPRNLIGHHFDLAPKGSTVRVTMWNITDDAIVATMTAAIRRGVHVQVVMASSNCDQTAAVALREVTAAYKGSFVTCAKGSARSAGGVMHQKSYTFSKVGSVANVTVVGSANATTEAYADQWVDLFQYVNRADVYRAYNAVFALQAKDKDLAKPYRSYSFNDGLGGAQFYPINTARPTAADDPAHHRISTIPKGKGTVIKVATYAMHGKRANWLAADLIAQRKAGSSVSVLTGPPADDKLEATFRAHHIPVTRAFDPGCREVENDPCNYIHLKLMTATFVRDGKRQYRVWTGTDNFTDDALNSDEVVQKIGSKAAYDQYVGYLATIAATY